MTEYFSNIKEILQTSQFCSLNPTLGRIFTDWDVLVGKKFSKKTTLIDIKRKGSKYLLLIQVISSPLAQELQFFKHNLIKKIKDNYGLEVIDISIKVASIKQEIPSSLKPSEVLEVYTQRPTEEELTQIILDNAIMEEIKMSVEKQKTLTTAQKDKMLKIIMEDLKTQEWMKSKGFPICEKCGRVITHRKFDDKNICSACKGSL